MQLEENQTNYFTRALKFFGAYYKNVEIYTKKVKKNTKSVLDIRNLTPRSILIRMNILQLNALEYRVDCAWIWELGYLEARVINVL